MAAEHITNADIVAVFTEAKKSLVGMAYGGFVCNIIEDFSSLSREYRQLWLDSLIMEFSSYDPAGNPPPLKS